jgi:hypothetical protein
MKQKGFSRLIRANDGRTYRMPWAEYNGNANLTTMEILNIAGEVANGTGKQNAVLVTEAASRAWIGLPVLAGGVG